MVWNAKKEVKTVHRLKMCLTDHCEMVNDADESKCTTYLRGLFNTSNTHDTLINRA